MGMAGSSTSTYFQLFDLGNPFPGLLPQDQYASHTYDIVALLGAYEDRHDDQAREVIRNWREIILNYIADGTAPCTEYSTKRGGLLIDKEGVRSTTQQDMPGAARRDKLWDLAWAEKKEEGLDFLWEGVCRRWLDQGS